MSIFVVWQGYTPCTRAFGQVVLEGLSSEFFGPITTLINTSTNHEKRESWTICWKVEKIWSYGSCPSLLVLLWQLTMSTLQSYDSLALCVVIGNSNRVSEKYKWMIPQNKSCSRNEGKCQQWICSEQHWGPTGRRRDGGLTRACWFAHQPNKSLYNFRGLVWCGF